MKTMRTAVFLALITLLALPAAAVHASPWDLSAGLQNGYWLEVFGIGGEGSDGGMLTAEGLGESRQWSLSGVQIGGAEYIGSGSDDKGDYLQYRSRYANLDNPSSLQLDDEPFFSLPDGSTFLLTTAVNTSRHYGDGSLWFEFAAGGTDLGGAYNCLLIATWYGTPADFGFGHASFGADGYEENIGFQSLNLEITAVPLPGAVLLLASGLAGIAGIRSRFQRG